MAAAGLSQAQQISLPAPAFLLYTCIALSVAALAASRLPSCLPSLSPSFLLVLLGWPLLAQSPPPPPPPACASRGHEPALPAAVAPPGPPCCLPLPTPLPLLALTQEEAGALLPGRGGLWACTDQLGKQPASTHHRSQDKPAGEGGGVSQRGRHHRGRVSSRRRGSVGRPQVLSRWMTHSRSAVCGVPGGCGGCRHLTILGVMHRSLSTSSTAPSLPTLGGHDNNTPSRTSMAHTHVTRDQVLSVDRCVCSRTVRRSWWRRRR